jgi:hypothetical protein
MGGGVVLQDIKRVYWGGGFALQDIKWDYGRMGESSRILKGVKWGVLHGFYGNKDNGLTKER